MTEQEQLKQWIDESENIVFFGGAGVSTVRCLRNQMTREYGKLEAEGKLRAVITQNIDGLHQKAGSKEVYELHGSVLRNYCSHCHAFYSLDDILAATGVPHCHCGGIIKPDVVLYEEGLDSYVLERAISYIRNADMLIIGGTSLAVYPAAGLIDYYEGNKLVLINRDKTTRDSQANLIIHDAIGKVLAPWA